MKIQELIDSSTKLYTTKYYDKEGILRAKVAKTRIGNELNRKKLVYGGFKIVESNEINCKSSNFEEKIEEEIKKDSDLEELKKEVMKKWRLILSL